MEIERFLTRFKKKMNFSGGIARLKINVNKGAIPLEKELFLIRLLRLY